MRLSFSLLEENKNTETDSNLRSPFLEWYLGEIEELVSLGGSNGHGGSRYHC